ncbi:MAG: succinate--CoA ligase subunit alpha [Chloroflexi bacterium RBG_16_57_8]|nr:MAG: succinate--CoA ligase subunit alpha [Chloroflexi bacterium RBG_16_57_8]
MSIIVDKNTRVLVQGITGHEGSFHTRQMLRYGTRIVAGVTPGKGGQQVEGIPVYERVSEAISKHGANTSIIFVPAHSARSAILEALGSGITTLVVITESIPLKDTIEVMAYARKRSGVTIIGPNTAGVISPANGTHVGIMPSHIFRSGPVGMVSRSGTLTYEISSHMTKAGIGQSTCVVVGGDPVIGTGFVSVLEMFRHDDETKAVVLIGEIGGNAEELAARYIKETGYPKPVVAYIAGRTAPSEKRMGHAGAIIMGNTGSAMSKIVAFTAVGVQVAEKPSDVARLLLSVS